MERWKRLSRTLTFVTDFTDEEEVCAVAEEGTPPVMDALGGTLLVCEPEDAEGAPHTLVSNSSSTRVTLAAPFVLCCRCFGDASFTFTFVVVVLEADIRAQRLARKLDTFDAE
jgi:hypothetical protein